jgi:hypothetical protein
MVRTLLMVMSLYAPIAIAAEDFKITLLEQAVRDLQRQVEAQARQIDELRRQLSLPSGRSGTASPDVAGAGATGTALWLEASRWQKLQAGMGELEVINVLGPPTSMRSEQGRRVLLYAMEIGTSGFLSGSVTLQDRVVTEVRKPALK